MEGGSNNREESGGEKGAQEGGLLRSIRALRSAGGGPGGLEDREEGT